jgi:hypothetical protein
MASRRLLAGPVAAALAHLFLVHLSSGVIDKASKTINLAILFDFAEETINQRCDVDSEPHYNETQLSKFIRDRFDQSFNNTVYHLGKLTFYYSFFKWHTMTLTQEAIMDLHHAILFWGSDDNVKIAGTVANVQSVPVISLFPRHGWYRDGSKLSNVVVPRTGQSLRGRAALDLVKPPEGESTEFVIVIREEDGFSPELKEFNKTKQTARGVFVLDFPLTLNSLELASRDVQGTIDLPNRRNPDAIIVDSNLGELLKSLIAATIDYGFINENTVVIFLHEFYEVQKWSGLRLLANATSYIFAFQQRIPTSSDQDIHFNDAVAVDSLQGVARAANASTFSYNMDLEPVYLPNMSDPLFNLTHLTGGHRLVDAMIQKLCFPGISGKFSFTSGEALQDSCLNETIVEFDIMMINRTGILGNGSKCDHFWYKDGSWTGAAGLQRNGTWKLSVDEQTTAESVKVLLVPFGPFIYRDKKDMLMGVDWDLLGFIANHSAVGFNMTQVQVTMWNGTREEALKELGGTNVKYDLVMGAIISHASSEYISYTRSYFTLRMGIITLKGGKDFNVMWRFMKPFSWDVWLAAFATIVGGGFVSKWLGLTHSYEDGLWIAACTIFFMQENRLVQMRNPFGRIFIISMSLFVLILVASYTANMVSFLSPSEQSTHVFDPISSLIVTVDKEPYTGTLLQSTGYNFTTVDSVEEAIRLVRQGKAFGFIADLPLVRQTVLKAGPSCDLSIVGFFFLRSQYSIAVSRKFDPVLVNQIDRVIADAIPQSFVENSYLRHMKYDVSSPCWQESTVDDSILSESADDSEESLGINSFTGVAVLVACAAALSLALKGLMLLCHNMHHKKIGTAG